MASRRMIITRFFKDPDIMNLSSKDAQLILIGLVLAADDEGREVAHAGMLGREIDYPAEQIEAALQELAANDMLVLYQVGKHRYYQLSCQIRGWQTLGGRITPSRYPAPPASASPESEKPAESEHRGRGKSGKSRGKSAHFPEQFNLTEVNITEDGGNNPRKVVPFPTASTFSNDNADTQQTTETGPDAETRILVQQTARILKLPVTEALTRLVAEYAPITSLSVPGEADAAREWIDDRERNRKGRHMSLIFFRNWLKRELEAMKRRKLELEQTSLSTGTGGPSSARSGPPTARQRLPDLTHLAHEDQYRRHTKGEQH